jgi:heme/copper-type cytochrome/quinol oxidase subunit 2
MSNNSSEGYRSLRGVSQMTIGALVASLICDLLFVLFGIGELSLPYSFTLDSGESMSLWFLLIGLNGFLEIILLVLTAVFFLMWQYRAYKNLPALKIRNPEFTPGWTVGYWFIPILNLFRPFQIIRELWNESDPDFDPELGFLSHSLGAPTIISWWWAFWILSRIGGNISNTLANKESAIKDSSFALALIFTCVLSSAAAILAIQIVRSITQRQELRFEKLGTDNYLPPPPPKFD